MVKFCAAANLCFVQIVAPKEQVGDCPTGFAASTIAVVLSPGMQSSSIHTMVAFSLKGATQNVIARNHRHCRSLLVVTRFWIVRYFL